MILPWSFLVSSENLEFQRGADSYAFSLKINKFVVYNASNKIWFHRTDLWLCMLFL